MKITYTNKSAQNQLQESDFLKLSPSERVVQFFLLSKQMQFFPTKARSKHNEGNFEIVFYDAGMGR